MFPVGQVLNSHLQGYDVKTVSQSDSEAKDEDEGGGVVDNAPHDAFEAACVEIEAPGPSLNRVPQNQPANGTGGRRQPREVQDCQWWVRQVVSVLMQRGLLEPLPFAADSDGSKDPWQIVQTLPMH